MTLLEIEKRLTDEGYEAIVKPHFGFVHCIALDRYQRPKFGSITRISYKDRSFIVSWDKNTGTAEERFPTEKAWLGFMREKFPTAP